MKASKYAKVGALMIAAASYTGTAQADDLTLCWQPGIRLTRWLS